MSEEFRRPGKLPSQGTTILPDTLFKLVTRQQVEEQHLRVSDTEFQHVTRADMVIEVPEGTDTTDTIFDFCSPTTILEFKSENDPFDLREFVRNQVRTAILFLQSNESDYNQFLNVFVLARYPKDFLDNAFESGIVFTVDEKRPWLRWATVGFQKVALIICRDLPIERRFYRWLLFAPSDGKKWNRFIRRLYAEEVVELLDLAKQLRPKEFYMLKLNAKEIWEQVRKEGGLPPQEEARLAKERAEGIEILLNDLDNKEYIQMKYSFDDMTDEQVSRMVNQLSPIRLAGLIGYLNPAQVERAVPLIKSEENRNLIGQLLKAQNSK